MGMAASQARYLQLTARKTNVEYAGQQINQQRTALSNESAGLFTQLMGLKVPTAPSSGDFSTTQYSFSDGQNNCTISNMEDISNDANYNKMVSYYYTTTIDKGIGKTRSDLGVNNVITTDDNGTPLDPSDDVQTNNYWLTNGATKANQILLRQCKPTDTSTSTNGITSYADEYAALLQICKDNPSSNLADDLDYNPTTQALGNVTGAYTYTNANGLNYYYSVSDLASAAQSGGSAVVLTGYYSSEISEKVYTKSKALVESTDSGRYSSIKLENYSSSFDLDAKTTTDTVAYNDAMNDYEYQQTAYEQQVTAINAKTCIIQQEDKTLELKLAQLDTEQKALSTEMDSVKKVIDKNVEQTFKTFS